MQIINISAYKFVTLNDTEALRPHFQDITGQLKLKGTILLSPEGINMFLAGSRSAIDGFMEWLKRDERFSDITPKESISDSQPFNRMLVKLKREIITMKMPVIKPEKGRAPSVDAPTLKRWLDVGHDDTGRPVVMLDTRNAFEVDVGTFENAIDYRITKFSEFPDVIAKHKEQLADKTIVSFCTGGIRCEKAAIHMREIGLEHTLQLEGGILKYFEEVGGAHYNGDCFVFDYRTALTPKLEPAGALQCFACRSVVTVEEQASLLYQPPIQCPQCAKPAQLAA